MKHGKSKPVRKPNALLYYPVCFFANLYYRLVYRLKTDKSAIRGIKPPYLVVAGHSCWLDYIITSVSMFPTRMNYVGAFNFFRDRVLKTVFTWMGVIPKYQFTSDMSAVKKMKGVIDRGGIVTLFPHGCLSNEGRPGGYAVFGIARLIKFLNVPVIAIKTDGGYLTRPRWTQHARYGRMETRVTPVLSNEDILHLSEEQIYQKVLEAIHFDDYRWQRERKVPFRGKNLAEGVEYVLYKCPKCGGEFILSSSGNTLACDHCGNAVVMNRYLMFEPESRDTIFYDAIDTWYDYQGDCLKKEIEDPAFRLIAQTELKCAEPGKYGYQHLGHGTVTLTRESVIYTGTVQEEETNLVFPMKNIPMVPYAAGEYIEIARGPEISRFVFDNPRLYIKWVMAVRMIRDQYYEREQGL